MHRAHGPDDRGQQQADGHPRPEDHRSPPGASAIYGEIFQHGSGDGGRQQPLLIVGDHADFGPRIREPLGRFALSHHTQCRNQLGGELRRGDGIIRIGPRGDKVRLAKHPRHRAGSQHRRHHPAQLPIVRVTRHGVNDAPAARIHMGRGVAGSHRAGVGRHQLRAGHGRVVQSFAAGHLGKVLLEELPLILHGAVFFDRVGVGRFGGLSSGHDGVADPDRVKRGDRPLLLAGERVDLIRVHLRGNDTELGDRHAQCHVVVDLLNGQARLGREALRTFGGGDSREHGHRAQRVVRLVQHRLEVVARLDELLVPFELEQVGGVACALIDGIALDHPCQRQRHQQRQQSRQHACRQRPRASSAHGGGRLRMHHNRSPFGGHRVATQGFSDVSALLFRIILNLVCHRLDVACVRVVRDLTEHLI